MNTVKPFSLLLLLQWRLDSGFAYHGLRTQSGGRDGSHSSAFALKLGVLCVPHICRCDAQVDAFRVHSLVCKHVSGRIIRHQAINDIIARAFASADIPITKEPICPWLIINDQMASLFCLGGKANHLHGM